MSDLDFLPEQDEEEVTLTPEKIAEKIKGMTWSYSRLKAFSDCKYRWFLKYIHEPKLDSIDLFFSDYGKFVHTLLAKYYSGESSADDVTDEYLTGFQSNVHGTPPNQRILGGYFSDGLRFLKEELQPLPYRPIAVEQKLKFEVDGIPLVGIIDVLAETEDGELVIIDHKSRALKPRNGRKRPTKATMELDEYLKQLYLYAEAVYQSYGKYPKLLCFNCFRTNTLIEEPYLPEKGREAVKWLEDSVAEILNEAEFSAAPEYWKCNHLCEMHDHCECYQMNWGGGGT